MLLKSQSYTAQFLIARCLAGLVYFMQNFLILRFLALDKGGSHMNCWIRYSDSESSAMVASSSINNFGLHNRALAKAICWRWPSERWIPRSFTRVSMPCGISLTKTFALASYKTFQRSLSDALSNGHSRLSRMWEWNKAAGPVGHNRPSLKLFWCHSSSGTPSMSTWPCSGICNPGQGQWWLTCLSRIHIPALSSALCGYASLLLSMSACDQGK